jgi:hypothetical protein
MYERFVDVGESVKLGARAVANRRTGQVICIWTEFLIRSSIENPVMNQINHRVRGQVWQRVAGLLRE